MSKVEEELDGCTFTPDIGRKGIVYETIKAERSRSKNAAKDKKNEGLEATGGSFRDTQRDTSDKSQRSNKIAIRSDLVRTSDRFYED